MTTNAEQLVTKNDPVVLTGEQIADLYMACERSVESWREAGWRNADDENYYADQIRAAQALSDLLVGCSRVEVTPGA